MDADFKIKEVCLRHAVDVGLSGHISSMIAAKDRSNYCNHEGASARLMAVAKMSDVRHPFSTKIG